MRRGETDSAPTVRCAPRFACLGGVPHRRREEIEGEEREAEGSGTPAWRRTWLGRRQRTEEDATTGSFALSVGKGDVLGPNPLAVRDAKDEMPFVFRSPRLETVLHECRTSQAVTHPNKNL